MKYSKQQVLDFLTKTKLKNYQRIPLPYGLEVKGTDLQTSADRLLPKNLTGKSIVDVGCNYGFFCHEAKKRGAENVIGVEINPETARIARMISNIVGDGVKIVNTADTLKGKYDLILLLNVTHHLRDPIDFIRGLSKKCRNMVIEFPTLDDEAFAVRDKGVKIYFPDLTLIQKVLYKLKLQMLRFFFKQIADRYGMIGVGSIAYDNTFYFNQRAFDYTFRLHNRIFRKIRFKQSARFPHRKIAYCTV